MKVNKDMAKNESSNVLMVIKQIVWFFVMVDTVSWFRNSPFVILTKKGMEFKNFQPGNFIQQYFYYSAFKVNK